jgi:CelD/BcsL family acetyltransferase involved in cellulose biosynthesis
VSFIRTKVEQGKGKKAETIWTHYAVTLVQLHRTQGIIDSTRIDSVAASAVLMAHCTNSGSAAALAERRNTEKNCHQKKIKREQKKSENGRKTFGHVNKILLPKKEAELTWSLPQPSASVGIISPISLIILIIYTPDII